MNSDLRGENLNRHYRDPDPVLHPSIFAVKELVRYLENISFYIDLHAHCNKRGYFLFGNNLTDINDQIENVMFPKILSLNSPHFDFQACGFSAKNMISKSKRDGLSKDGTGRVALYQETGLVHCYTVECNYSTGRILNHISPIAALEKEGARGMEKRALRRMKPKKSLRAPPKYTIEIFQEMGEAIAVSLLDFYEINPYSRIPRSPHRNMNRLRGSVTRYVSSKKFRKHSKKKDDTIASSDTSSGSLTSNSTIQESNRSSTLNVFNDMEHLASRKDEIDTLEIDKLEEAEEFLSTQSLQASDASGHLTLESFAPSDSSSSDTDTSSLGPMRERILSMANTAEELSMSIDQHDNSRIVIKTKSASGSRILSLIRERESVELDIRTHLGSEIRSQMDTKDAQDTLEEDEEDASLFRLDSKSKHNIVK